MFEEGDIKIMPPRTADRWYCSKCGEPTGKPEPGMLLVDPRYSSGFCDCTPGRHSRVSGYHREMMVLVADFEWDREAWLAKQRQKADKKAFDKANAGMPCTQEEWAGVHRYCVSAGLPVIKRA